MTFFGEDEYESVESHKLDPDMKARNALKLLKGYPEFSSLLGLGCIEGPEELCSEPLVYRSFRRIYRRLEKAARLAEDLNIYIDRSLDRRGI